MSWDFVGILQKKDMNGLCKNIKEFIENDLRYS